MVSSLPNRRMAGFDEGQSRFRFKSVKFQVPAASLSQEEMMVEERKRGQAIGLGSPGL